MMSQVIPAHRGINAIISLNGTPLAGQKGALLTRAASPINITNKITGEWQTSLQGLKSWKLSCQGAFIKNEESFNILEDCFNNNTPLEIKLTRGEKIYRGQALITSFPIVADYNDVYTYNIQFIGLGELLYENSTN